MNKPFTHAVTGDFSRMTYSMHRSAAAAERAARALAAKWRREDGWIHPGSEPRVVALDSRPR